jgi:hypothetical protein
MRNIRSLRQTTATLLIVVAIALTVGTTDPARADPSRSVESRESEMAFTPWTRENLGDHGYEIRYNDRGEAYGVPEGTPHGSDVGATAIIVATDDEVGSLGEVRGSCGTSFVSFSSPRIVRTGYYISPDKGAPISHTWSVLLRSTIDIELLDMSGAAPWGNQSWQTSRTYGLEYLRGSTVSALASGTVLTTAGICVSGDPTEVTTP